MEGIMDFGKAVEAANSLSTEEVYKLEQERLKQLSQAWQIFIYVIDELGIRIGNTEFFSREDQAMTAITKNIQEMRVKHPTSVRVVVDVVFPHSTEHHGGSSGNV
jgi:hypothetical protein